MFTTIGLLWLAVWFGLLVFWGYKSWLRVKEREMDLRAMGRLPQMTSRQSSVEMRRLVDELNRLRDTTTQYDLTVEREIKALRERVAFLEACLRDRQQHSSASPRFAAAYDLGDSAAIAKSDEAVAVNVR